MRYLVFAIFFILCSGAHAQNRAAIEQQFQRWIENTIWPMARSKGVSQKTLKKAFDGVTLNWTLPDLVPPGEATKTPKRQSQAEFRSPARYFNANSVRNATSVGKKMARRHATVLNRVEAETGVPARIILAIWGRESGYGQVAIPHDAIEVLATKGFMSTRRTLFTQELIAALQISETGVAPPGRLKSSWAGALGQPQFMPSNFLAYAKDGSGDGRADIWTSPDDTIASIGHYLSQHGWVAGRDWGFEIDLPQNLSCALEGPDQGKLISEWQKLGVTRVSGKPFPDHELSGEGFLMLPAGRKGPAFLVTPNFYALKEYNKSDLYALFVGHVGDRIQFNMNDFSGRWDDVGKLYRSEIAIMQQALENKGHDVGGVDGLPGFKTRRSIGRWQEATRQDPTCFPEKHMKAALTK